jgi:hypothetical protein
MLVRLLLHVSARFYGHHQVVNRSIYTKYDLGRGIIESLGNKVVTNAMLCILCIIQGDQKVSVHLTITVKKRAKIQYFKQNTFGMWTVLYRTRSSRTQFGVSINVWRMAGDTLNTTCNFLHCNHQVHRDFLITLYIYVEFWNLNPVQLWLFSFSLFQTAWWWPYCPEQVVDRMTDRWKCFVWTYCIYDYSKRIEDELS